MIWQIPKMWEGGECWIIGGGPSIPREFGVPEEIIDDVIMRRQTIDAYSPFLSTIHDRHVIGINAAFFLGSWIDICFFGDGGFYLQNRRELGRFPKLKVSCNPNTRKKMDPNDNIKFVKRDNRSPYGISRNNNSVSWNGNSGAAAISLAYHLGVKRIYLLGFDMKLGGDNRQHFHSHYHNTRGSRINAKKLPFDRHLRGFPHIAKDARRLGIEILNVSPDSAIKEFKKVRLIDVL